MFSQILSYVSVTPPLLFAATSAAQAQTPWPNGPFTTRDSSIVDASGNRFTYAGVNWPGAAETMLPEGLQYQSVETIVSRIKSLGMNSIRLTYATEMIDQVYANNMTDVPIVTAFVDALGADNGTAVFDRITANNPSFNQNTTRLQVYDAIAEECARQNIYVHLDNHVSKASWCCSPFDGNAWWNDTYFSPANWTRGLAYMASHGKQWPNLISMSLYNELRPPLGASTSPGVLDSYTWAAWYDQLRAGARAIHDANGDVLLFLLGLDGDTDLQPVADGAALAPGSAAFRRADFPGDRLVLELHSYDILAPVADCPSYDANLLEKGYSAAAAVEPDTENATSSTTTERNRFPVVMTEWGFSNDDADLWRNGTYATCVQRFLRGTGAAAGGWMVWVVAGSYYVRQGAQDYDESWGLLSRDWSAWRNPEFIEGGLKPLVTASLASVNGSNGSTGSNGSAGAGGEGSSQSFGMRWGPEGWEWSSFSLIMALSWGMVASFLLGV